MLIRNAKQAMCLAQWDPLGPPGTPLWDPSGLSSDPSGTLPDALRTPLGTIPDRFGITLCSPAALIYYIHKGF